MVNFYVTYTAESKEVREKFIEEIIENEIDKKSQAEDGCIRYEYYYPVNSDTEIFLFEQWESLEHQKVHTTQPHFAVVGKIKEKYNVTAKLVIE